MVYSGWQVYMAERTSRCRLACEASVSVGLESKEWSRNGILDVLHARKILKPAFNPFDNLFTLYLVVSEMERAKWQTFPIQKQYSLLEIVSLSLLQLREGVKRRRRGLKECRSEGVQECLKCRGEGVKGCTSAEARERGSEEAKWAAKEQRSKFRPPYLQRIRFWVWPRPRIE